MLAFHETNAMCHTASSYRSMPWNALLVVLLLWLSSVWMQVKQENPGIAFTEVAKVMGEKWRSVTADEKKGFEEMAAKDKARYEEEMAAYKATKAETHDSD